MIVAIEREIWEEAGVDALAVVSVLASCKGRRHQLLVNPRDRPRLDAWIDTHTAKRSDLKRRLTAVISEAEKTAPNAGSTAARLTVVHQGTDWRRARVDPPLAARMLQRPLKLLVENARNDGAFVKRIAEPSDRRALEEAEKAGWIEFEQGGGLTEILHRLRDLAGSSEPEAMIARGRLWVLFDRDAHEANRACESKNSRSVRELATTITTPWPLKAHQLQRRSIENYVPLAAMRRCCKDSKHHAWIEAYARLKPDQRHNFNIKKGLAGEQDDAVFRGMDAADRAALMGKGPNLKGIFPKVYDSELTQELDARERKQMIASILERM